MGATGRFGWGGDRKSENFKLLKNEDAQKKDQRRTRDRDKSIR